MLSYALSTATTYFHLPVDEDEERDIEGYQRKSIAWKSSDSLLPSSSSDPLVPPSSNSDASGVLRQVLDNDDLYKVLGISKASATSKTDLRRAYLSRSRACHPDKFPAGKEQATLAFQKIAVAYDVLSNPSSKRIYDARSPSSTYDVFAARPMGYADETFRSVIIGIFNDFLDGDLEVIRSMLKTISDVNPAVNFGDGNIDAVLLALQSIRERALTCRTCIYALHAELTRLLEVQHAMSELSYFDIKARSRLTIQLTRITLSLPIALEKALEEQHLIYSTKKENSEHRSPILPRHLILLLSSIDVVLDKMERILKT